MPHALVQVVLQKSGIEDAEEVRRRRRWVGGGASCQVLIASLCIAVKAGGGCRELLWLPCATTLEPSLSAEMIVLMKKGASGVTSTGHKAVACLKVSVHRAFVG